MSFSVNTNVGAMVALQYLSLSAASLQHTENAVSTGLKVANAKDDGSTAQIKVLASADGSRSLTTTAQNMSLGGSIVSVAATGTVSTQTKASTMIGTVETSLVAVNSALAQLSAGRPGQQHAVGRIDPGYLAALVRACGQPDAVPPRTPAAGAAPGLAEPLTNRELEVLRLLAAGLSNQRIAHDLVVALDTVKKHVTHVLGKLGAANRTEAVARARQFGLIP